MILRARAIWAHKGLLIEDGAVRVQGNRITGVGKRGELPPNDGEPMVDIGDSIMFPAFVNAHCHLDYTSLSCKLSHDSSFTEWLEQIISLKKSLTIDDYRKAWLSGADMLIKSGCATVANIESVPGLFAQVAQLTSLQVCPFTEIIAYLDNEIIDIVKLINRELMVNKPLALKVGISPHAPYTTTSEVLRVLTRVANEKSIPTAIHLAESDEEWEMFSEGTGRLYDVMHSLGRTMDDCGRCSPVQHLANSNGFSNKSLVVHANRLHSSDVATISTRGVSVVHCPVSHAWFSRDDFDCNRLAKAGINIALGTDSLASAGSSGDRTELSMFSEMQQFHIENTNRKKEDILQMATENGAKALGMEGELGQIKNDFIANIAALPFSGNMQQVFDAILYHQGPVGMLLIEGKCAFSGPNAVAG